MLEELKKINGSIKKEEIIFFLKNIIGNRGILNADLKMLCAHTPSGYKISCDTMLSYCTKFGWIIISDYVRLDTSLYQYLSSPERLNVELITQTVDQIFKERIFTNDMFMYDANRGKIIFKNELLSLENSLFRNVLINQGFFDIIRDLHRNLIVVNPNFESLVMRLCTKNKKIFTLNQLKIKMERDSILGDKAEEFVLNFEKKRITNAILKKRIKIISQFDVRAGYDVISFESDNSVQYDRYIEVKAVSKQNGFFWSSNEYEAAKRKGMEYYLYLVDVSAINRDTYNPIIINNPALTIMKSDNWLVEIETYNIKMI